MRHPSLISSHDSFWHAFFEDGLDADEIAGRIQCVSAQARFSRPDWNTLLTPLILEDEALRALSGCLAELRRIMRTMPDRLYAGDMDAFLCGAGFPPEAAAALHLPSAGLLPARWDIVESTAGWKAVELNAGGALGVFAYDAVQSIYDDILVANGRGGSEHWCSLGRDLGREIDALIEAHGATRLVVVVDSSTASTYAPIASVVASMLSEQLGGQVDVCDESEAASLAGEARAPLIAYQCCSISDRAHVPDRYAAYDGAVADGAIVQTIDPLADVLASKAILAMTWRCLDEDRLSAEEARLVESVLPRTVLASDSNRVGGTEERRHWVLKTVFGHGGYDVRCGWELSQEQWAAALGTASEGELSILQRRVRGIDRNGIGMTPDGTFLHIMAPQLLGLFQQGDTFCGACARQSPHNGGVVSVGAGAALGVVRSVTVGSAEA